MPRAQLVEGCSDALRPWTNTLIAGALFGGRILRHFRERPAGRRLERSVRCRARIERAATRAQASRSRASSGRLERLALSADVLPSSGSPAAIQPAKPFKLEANDYGLSQISLALSDKACVISADGHSISCGWETWQLGETALPIKPPRLIAGGKPKSDAVFKVAAHETQV